MPGVLAEEKGEGMIALCVVSWLLIAVASMFLAAHLEGLLDLTGVLVCLLAAPFAFLVLLTMTGQDVVLWRRKG